jgi:hypothetical protein
VPFSLEVLVMTRLDDLLRRTGPIGLVLALGSGLLPANALAQAQQSETEEEEALFRIQRIEISAFGAWVGGADYLDLPAPLTPLTNDTGADDILDFSGNVPYQGLDYPDYNGVIAPHKELEPGWKAGVSTTFYLTPNFGITLTGGYGQADAVFTGQIVELQPDPDNLPGEDDTIEVPQPRSEIDRASLKIWNGEAGIIYHILSERKHSTRPFVTLGIGGILNQFPDTDDVSALTWNVGGGIGFPVAGPIRGFVSANLRFYVWETDEVDLDETLVFPEVYAGLVWRYMVPEEVVPDEPAPTLPEPGAEEPSETPEEGGSGEG